MVGAEFNSRSGMSSPYSAESPSPYSDCSSGVPSPPTVLADFNRPVEAVHHDGPYITIVEQPQSKFRFRYKSEMAGTHGQLKAERADRNRNIFPTVKLCKWNGGPALIRLSLYTAEDNNINRKRHVHELSGKSCNKDTGICEMVVDEKGDYTAQFQNLGIIHIAKRDVKDIIFTRKKDIMFKHAMLRRPGWSLEDVQRSITQIDLKKLEEDAEDEAKSMDLNKVVLRYQAFHYSESLKDYRPITMPVDSEVVFNLKNASTGELKIVRMSACSAPCTGGTEVWILVEKVKKNNVKIKFFETDYNDREIWTAYGEFSDSDVHHQYAIVFKTPPYHNTNLRDPVRVKVQLERPTDHDVSEPLDFEYLPDSRKRGISFVNTEVIDRKDQYFRNPPSKRAHYSPEKDIKPMNLIVRPNNGARDQHENILQTPDIIDIIENAYSNSGSPQGFFGDSNQPQLPSQSPQHMVPSPGYGSDSNQSMFSPTHESTTANSNNFLQMVDSPQYMLSPPDSNIGSPQQYQASIGGGVSPNYNTMQSPHYAPSNSPGDMMPSPQHYQDNNNMNLNQMQQQQHQQNQLQQQQLQLQQQQLQLQQQQLQLQPQQQQQLQQPQILLPQINIPDDFLFSDPEQSGLQTIDLLDVSEGLNFTFMGTDGDIHTDHAGQDSKKGSKPKGTKSEIDDLTKLMAGVKVEEESTANSQKIGSAAPQRNVDVAFRVAVSAAECLQAYAATGDISLLLATHRYLLAVQNNQGDTALHTAVCNKNLEAFNKILKASEKVRPQDLLNAQNFANETALHQAVSVNEHIMVSHLIGTPGCDVSITDTNGNTPIHLAASLSDHQCLAALLTGPRNGARSALSNAINAYNYHGETPLHLAVMSGNLLMVQLLIQAGAQVHQCERKRGANPLHLCAERGQHSIAQYLIDNTGVTVEAGMFDGNTPLHLAAQYRDKNMCRVLLKAKADPIAKNFLVRRSRVSESETVKEEEADEDNEEEEEDNYYTPLDYAGDNQEIVSILRGVEAEVDVSPAVQEAAAVPAAGKKAEDSNPNPMDSGIELSVTDIQVPESTDEMSVGDLSSRVRSRLSAQLSGDTWRHLAQVLDMDYLVPYLAKEPQPANALMHPDNMRSVSLDRFRECLQVLGLKSCITILDEA
ncbi:unnamed protein product [Meganyctiphanes norvegica]|uniref:RHD domain-containing protein n=1 Tax=Meganyctiphanes norvegica TaxID=48144 RepID=A0AAV2RX68_MEGNR